MSPAGFPESTRSRELRPPGKVTARLAEDNVHPSAELVSLGLEEAEPEHPRFQGFDITPREVQPGVEVRRR